MKKRNFFIVILLLVGVALNAQIKFGVTAGLNLANEGTTVSKDMASYTNEGSLKGLTIGPTVEAMIPIIGIGGEISALYSRKGSNFKYDVGSSDMDMNVSLTGYRSISYIDVPLNLKYKMGIGLINLYAVGGWYWSFALGGKVVVDNAVDMTTGEALPELVKKTNMSFSHSYDNFDTGWDIGAGVELLKKIQLGVYYSASVKNTATQQAMQDILNSSSYTGSFSTKNRVLSVRLTYLF